VKFFLKTTLKHFLMGFNETGQLESLESRQKSFFASCRKTRVADREEEFQKIRQEYKKVKYFQLT